MIELLMWIAGKKNRIIFDSRELKTLSAVVGTPAALAKLREGYELSTASQYTGEALNDYRNIVLKAHNLLDEADTLSVSDMEFEDADFDNIARLVRVAQKIQRYIKSRLEGEE